VPTASGIVILVCVLLSVVLVRLALNDLRDSRRGSWYPLGLTALLLGLAAVAVQCWQYTDLAFGTEEGGYASVYLGWTGTFTLFAFGAMIWLEILLATARRTSSPPVAEESSVASFSIFWTTLGVVQVFAFILLFGVK
jgi:heme/copper-type cytochrome/quinol oxidase subunit 3